MNEQFLIILFDVTIYVISFLFFLIKYKEINVGVFLLFLMTISHIGMIPYYWILKDLGASFENITLIPFIYLYIMIMVGLYPFLKKQEKKIVYLGRNKEILFCFAIFIIIVSVEPFLENLILLFNRSHSFSEIYDEKREEGLDIYTGLGGRLMNVTRYLNSFATVLFFYYLSKYKNNKYLIMGLLISQINFFLNGINTASRGGIISQLTMCILCFLFFKHTYSDIILSRIKKVAFLVAIPFFLFTYLISISRYESKNNVRDFDGFILLYLSEGPLKFNAQMWDGNHNTNGDVNMNLIKSILGFDTYTTYESRDSHYTRINGRRIEQFYTYVGDFVSDFGIGGAAIVCLLISTVSSLLLKRQKIIPIHNLFILLLIAHMYSIGFTSNLYRAYFLQKNVLVTIIICILLSFRYKTNRRPGVF